MKSILPLLVSGHLEAPYYGIRYAENGFPVMVFLWGGWVLKCGLTFSCHLSLLPALLLSLGVQHSVPYRVTVFVTLQSSGSFPPESPLGAMQPLCLSNTSSPDHRQVFCSSVVPTPSQWQSPPWLRPGNVLRLVPHMLSVWLSKQLSGLSSLRHTYNLELGRSS